MKFVIFLSFTFCLTAGNDFEIISADVIHNNSSEKICLPPRVCVPHYQCLESGVYNKYGGNILEPKFRSTDIKDKIHQNQSAQNAIENLRLLLNGTEPIICGLLERCCDVGLPPPLVPNKTLQYKDCGLISNDQRLPWIVTLVKAYPATMSDFLCSGSLIHRHVILTSANCIYGFHKMDVKVRAGDISNQERSINDYVIHHDFNPRNLNHDIALVFVHVPFDLNANLQRICLPENDLPPNSDVKYFTITWYTKETDYGMAYETITIVNVTVVPANECELQLRRSRLDFRFRLQNSIVCASSIGERDISNEDEGLPLLYRFENEDNRYYQRGVVSWSINEGAERFPDVYTDVAAHIDWIELEIYNYNINSARS